jgi:hypothetical protein
MGKRPDRIIMIGWATLVGAAIVTEMRKPQAERTGHGTVAGVVPYDLRPPTLKRIRTTLWNPENKALLVPHVFGVGWTINLARARDLIVSRGRRDASAGGRPR